MLPRVEAERSSVGFSRAVGRALSLVSRPAGGAPAHWVLWWSRSLARPSTQRQPIHMKRTNLVLREDLLEEATRLSGEKTYSRAVDRALEDFVRRHKARRILEHTGTGSWEGALAGMRRDPPARKKGRP